MADVLHKDLTGSDIHEPKDVTTATAGQVYIADGAGGGDWIFPTSGAAGQVEKDVGTHITTLVDATDIKVAGPTTLDPDSFNIDDGGGFDNRLRFTGTTPSHQFITMAIFAASTNSSIVVDFKVIKNGTTTVATLFNITFTTTASNIGFLGLDLSVTNDFYEVFVSRVSGPGDLSATAFNLNSIGV